MPEYNKPSDDESINHKNQKNHIDIQHQKIFNAKIYANLRTIIFRKFPDPSKAYVT